MMGTKPSSATCATFCGSLTPSNRRTATYIALAYLLREGGTLRPRLKSFNVFSVKGYKGWRNFRESPKGEVRRTPIPHTRVNKGERMSRWGNTGRDEGSVPIMGITQSVGKREVECE